ncbi:MAG: hypothetical protein HOP19_21475 [Acidobacteria bacterium]|nr:hypothetical protein [Acidobacteriota bacterium]
MGWELRNGRRYYYSKKRVNGRVVSSYCGIGLLVELVATMGELSDVERRELKALRQREEAIDARLDGLGAQLQAAIKAGLQAAGFHQHKGTWRKKRMAKALAKKDNQALAPFDGITSYIDAYLNISNWEEANPGRSVPSHLRERFDAAQQANPDAWRALGDLVKLEFDRLIERASSSYPDRESIRKACEHLEAEQGYATASPLERLTIKEIVLAWLRLHEVQKQHTLAHREIA